MCTLCKVCKNEIPTVKLRKKPVKIWYFYARGDPKICLMRCPGLLWLPFYAFFNSRGGFFCESDPGIKPVLLYWKFKPYPGKVTFCSRTKKVASVHGFYEILWCRRLFFVIIFERQVSMVLLYPNIARKYQTESFWKQAGILYVHRK